MSLASRSRYWLPLLPLLALLGMTYWLDNQARPEEPPADSGGRHDPDAIMENFSAVRLSDQGSPRFVMAAKTLRHFPYDDSTVLEVPRLTLLSEGHPPIHLIARQGSVSSKGDEVFLRDDVEVLREAVAHRSELRVHTDFLRIIPDREWAETHLPVTMVDARNTLHAVGMELDNRAHTLKLLAQVRSEHATAQR